MVFKCHSPFLERRNLRILILGLREEGGFGEGEEIGVATLSGYVHLLTIRMAEELMEKESAFTYKVSW